MFENRFTHQILDISYNQTYIVVKYKLRNELETIQSKAKFESYKKNGIEIKYDYGYGEYSLREDSIVKL